MAFHESQLAAIRHFTGPMMVLAGPGSGKTTVITHRVRHLIGERGVDPGSILVITFTRAAADEMKERFGKLMGGQRLPVSFGTFHAVFFSILKYAYHYDASCIAREDQRRQLIRELFHRHRVDSENEAELAAEVLSEISIVKGGLMDLEHYYAKACPEQTFRVLFEDYQREMKRRRLIDFDDMLLQCRELFLKRKDILRGWQQKFRFILVDEFQDINRIQYEIVRMLAAPEDNLFIVGDDDQSIYRFRGAKPDIMLGFPKNYPKAKQVLLGVNYRSSSAIVSAAGRLIAHNRNRFPKEITAKRGAGRPVATCVWEDPQAETAAMVEEFRDYVKMGYAWSDIAVLYRTNSEPRLLTERLMQANIPFRTKDALPNPFEHWIARDLKAYLQAADGGPGRNCAARPDVLRIMNRPLRYISRDALGGEIVCWDKVEAWYLDKPWMIERVRQLRYDLKHIKGLAPFAAVNYVRRAVGYDDYLKEYAEAKGLEAEELFEAADALQESASGFLTAAAWFSHMESYGKRLQEQAQQRGRKDIDAVTLMTMHGAKGLEFPIVYILNANERVTPHHKAVLESDMEEERRMFYVAMTRAKDRLHVCYTKTRYEKPAQRSRFIDEYLGNAAPPENARSSPEVITGGGL